MNSFSMRMILITLVILTSGIHQVARSQHRYIPGEIVSNEGDTLKGYIKDQGHQSNIQFCAFKANPKAATEVYYPNQIRSFTLYDHSHYEVISGEEHGEKATMKPGEGFWEILVAGKMSLFQYGELFFVQKEDGPVVALTVVQKEVLGKDIKTGTIASGMAMHTQNRYKGVLASLASDYPQMAEAHLKVRLKPKDLSEFVVRYNQYAETGYRYYMEQRSLLDYTFGLAAGFSASTSSLKRQGGIAYTQAFEELDFAHAGLSNAGLFVWIRSNRLFEDFSLKTGLMVQQASYSSTRINQLTSYQEEFLNFHVDFTYVMIPLQLNIDFPGANVTHSLFLSMDLIPRVSGKPEDFSRQLVYSSNGAEPVTEEFIFDLEGFYPAIKYRQSLGYAISRRMANGLAFYSEAALYHIGHSLTAKLTDNSTRVDFKQTQLGLNITAGIKF